MLVKKANTWEEMTSQVQVAQDPQDITEILQLRLQTDRIRLVRISQVLT